MEQNKEKLLLEQVDILKGVIDVLQKEFASEGVEDEINFLSIVNGNLKKLAESFPSNCPK